MALGRGTRFGPYEILDSLGKGGMGEVYRARDIRLNRTVAVKILPKHFADDRQRRERFQREAETISSLNHPNICTLFDVGEQHGVHYLVMEHVEGETVQSRLERGQLPLSQVVEYAIQIASALTKAHGKGVVHRDLKPGNIMITGSGVKLLDFGLAKPTGPVPESSFSELPTEGEGPLTAEGAILGTLPYMAPEQLKRGEVDRRTDLFAFGAVVYEMASGVPPFESDSPARLISLILQSDPSPLRDAAPNVHPLLDRTISRCLAKDPDERWQTAGDLLFQLQSIALLAVPDHATRSGDDSRPERVRRRSAWTVGAAGTIAAALLLALLWMGSGPTEPAPAARFTLDPAPGTSFFSGYDLPLALSPDGRHLAYIAVDASGAKRLWLRTWASESAEPIVGTDGASMPFWSPNSEWIGFFTGENLKKVRVGGGPALTVASDVSAAGGAAWSTGDTILFSPSPTSGLLRVSAQGGSVTPATTLESSSGAGGHLWPQFLGEGDAFIYTGVSGAGGARSAIYTASLGGEAPRVLTEFAGVATRAVYSSGYLLFVDADGTLVARAFDHDRLQFSGEAIRILDGIPVTGSGRAPFSASADGTLVYWPSAVGTPAVLRWLDREGQFSAAVETPTRYVGFRLSSDGRRLVFSRAASSGRADLWVRDMTRGSESRLSSDGSSFSPIWSHDGTGVTYSAAVGSPPDLFVRDVNTVGPDLRVGTTERPDFPTSWSPDGEWIVSVAIDPVNRQDLWFWQVAEGRQAVGNPFPLNTRFNESQGRISPDGDWLAYHTDESGRYEVWVAAFPSGENRRQVSIEGGAYPEWRADGSELYYVSADRQLMATSFGEGELGIPGSLFRIDDLAEPSDLLIFPSSNIYVSASNGERFLVAFRTQDPNEPPMNVVLNWPDLLRR